MILIEQSNINRPLRHVVEEEAYSHSKKCRLERHLTRLGIPLLSRVRILITPDCIYLNHYSYKCRLVVYFPRSNLYCWAFWQSRDDGHQFQSLHNFMVYCQVTHNIATTPFIQGAPPPTSGEASAPNNSLLKAIFRMYVGWTCIY